MNIETGFRNAMHDAGIPTDAEIVGDGKLHRVNVEGDKSGTKNAWYVLHDGVCPAGAFGCNKRGISGKWRANQKREPLTEHDRTQIEAACKARAIAQEQGWADAAAIGEQIFQSAKGDASRHAYRIKKAIQPHGVKVDERDRLVIPIYSAVNGKLQSVQRIDAYGDKQMLSGGRAKGGCFPFSDVPDFWANAERRIGVCEGWATGASLAESLLTTAIFAAFSANNLGNVATALRARFTRAQITIFGDNDVSGVGQKYATDAALAVSGFVSIPSIPGCDWNDVLMDAAA